MTNVISVKWYEICINYAEDITITQSFYLSQWHWSGKMGDAVTLWWAQWSLVPQIINTDLMGKMLNP